MKEYWIQYHCFDSSGGDDIQDATIEADSEDQARHIAKVQHRARHIIKVLPIKDFEVKTDKLDTVIRGTDIVSVLRALRDNYNVNNHEFLTIKSHGN